MRAVVLVGGFGTRLRPLTLTTPKPLLPVGHRPILEHVLANLARGGVTEAVLSLGFKPDVFLEAYPDGRCAGVTLRYAVEPEPLDTAGAIRFAAITAGFDDERLLAVNGDVLTDLDVAALVAFHQERGAMATLHLTTVDDPSAYGVVPTDGDGRVLEFVEKPPRESAPTNKINAGSYILEPAVIARIPDGRRVSIERETFPALAAEGVLYAMATDDYWLGTGRPDQYLAANLDLLAGVRPVDPVAAVAEGAVVAGADVKASMIGRGARVDAGAIVRRSVLLPGSTVEAGATVTESILGRDVVVEAGATLRDAVIGDGQRITAAAVLDGVRIPEPD
jgi:mannose-1-phosphate guanylyltransferase